MGKQNRRNVPYLRNAECPKRSKTITCSAPLPPTAIGERGALLSPFNLRPLPTVPLVSLLLLRNALLLHEE